MTAPVLLGGVVAAAALDLLVKAWADAALPPAGLALLPFLSLDVHHNRGISFSLFEAETETGLVVLLSLQAAATAAIVWMVVRSGQRLDRVGFALLAGGALGNLVDRVLDGAVTDFLDLHPLGWRLFTFNLADLFITVGVALLAVGAAFGISAARREREAAQ